jgi:hypothetical protein
MIGGGQKHRNAGLTKGYDIEPGGQYSHGLDDVGNVIIEIE